MEKEIKISAEDTIDLTVDALLAAKDNGDHAYCDFNGHILHSDNVTLDSAYTEITGYSKAEYKERVKKSMKDYANKEKAKKSREEEYAKKVEASRTNKREPITREKVIRGLKFIAEHQSVNQDKLIDGLLELGCNFSSKDIKQQYPKEIDLYEGIRQGDISCGARIIANVRDSEDNRDYCSEAFLDSDDFFSIYHFIRVTTGDETYTKEIALNNESKKHK